MRLATSTTETLTDLTTDLVMANNNNNNQMYGNTTPHNLDLVLSNEEDMVSEIKHLSPLEVAITRLSHSSIVAMLTGQSHNINSIMAEGTL